ncbi:hypothetical protein DF040_09910 [Burkholderia cenocepacia]|nr:hypothetical protein DF040_09910 [Burkholderia cenocepacia]
MSRSWLPARKPRSTGARLSRFARAKIEIACGAFSPEKNHPKLSAAVSHAESAYGLYGHAFNNRALHFDYLNPKANETVTTGTTGLLLAMAVPCSRLSSPHDPT